LSDDFQEDCYSGDSIL